MTSFGFPIRNEIYVLDLLEALQLPPEIAVVKCAAHKSGCDFVAADNRYADVMARYRTLESCKLNSEHSDDSESEVATKTLLTVADTWEEIKTLQEEVPESKSERRVRAGCVKNQDEIWVSTDGKPVLPDAILSPMVRRFHGQTHI